jgi:hypothetical protein
MQLLADIQLPVSAQFKVSGSSNSKLQRRILAFREDN